MDNGIRELARRILRAAYRRRRDMFELEDLVAPRAEEVARELGYEFPADTTCVPQSSGWWTKRTSCPPPSFRERLRPMGFSTCSHQRGGTSWRRARLFTTLHIHPIT